MSEAPVIAPAAQQSASALRLGMVAGETSGDMLAASVLAGLHEQLGSAPQACGIGGPAMAREGFEAWWDAEQLAVRGYVEVLREYPRLRRMRSSLFERMRQWRPEVFIGVDAPDFNLDLERRLRESGIKVAHFIGPSIWAWRGERIHTIGRSVDHILLLFPFEKPLYDAAGIAATYVGHPLADTIPLQADPQAARARLGLPTQRAVVAVLPGSRGSEITYIAPVFMQTIAWLARQRPELSFVVPAATPRLFERLRTLMASAHLPQGIDCRLVLGQSHEAICAADAVLVASGTATLEVALFRKPMVIAYRMAWASYQIMRRMGYLPWIGLPNILCQDTVVPEFVQAAATPQAMGAALLAQLDDPLLRQHLNERFGQLHEALRRDCGRRAAETLLELARPTRA